MMSLDKHLLARSDIIASPLMYIAEMNRHSKIHVNIMMSVLSKVKAISYTQSGLKSKKSVVLQNCAVRLEYVQIGRFSEMYVNPFSAYACHWLSL